MFSQPTYPSLGLQVAEASPGSSGCTANPSWTGHPPTAGTLTATPTLSQTGQWRHAHSPVHILGLREGTGGPRENLCRCGENSKPHTDSGPSRESIFFFSHQHYNKTKLNKMTLFKKYKLLFKNLV